MGARGGARIEIDIARVPQRETGMTPYEIMLSESQERMLLVVKKGREAEVERIFDKWDLHAAHVGEVTGDGLLRVRDHGQIVAEIPNTALVDEAPVYDRPVRRPSDIDERQSLDLSVIAPVAPDAALVRLLGSPTIASKRWVYRQYDTMVRTNTIALAGMTAGLVRIMGTGRALALSTDGNGRYCYLNPRRGAMLALAEAARNVACAGGVPIGATNCLNFGNPERSEIMWQFVEAVEGLAEGCRALDIPITGGNVSLYNETDGSAIYPTPVIGVVGLIEDARQVLSRTFKSDGDSIIVLGENRGELGGSEYLKLLHGLVRGDVPVLDLGRERALLRLVADLAASGLARSAHDCADGGIAVTLAECCFDADGLGCDVDLQSPRSSQSPRALAVDATLFGESASRIVLSVPAIHETEVLRRAEAASVPAARVGRTGGSRLIVSVDGEPAIDAVVVETERIWSTSLEQFFTRVAA
jgi:phosphoribosylformylglycinamidine synthase